jgi:hypothetical protein
LLTREAPLGDVGRLTSDDKVFLGQRLFHYRANPELMDARFLAYVLQTPSVQGWIKGLGMGATVEHARVGDFHKIPVPTPPLNVQVRIGDILSAYDDLVENNRRRIALLEEAARMLYREWFVRFRFPSHEHVKIIDGIPEEWERRPLDRLPALTTEKRSRTSVLARSTPPCIAVDCPVGTNPGRFCRPPLACSGIIRYPVKTAPCAKVKISALVFLARRAETPSKVGPFITIGDASVGSF